jgi:cytochrome c
MLAIILFHASASGVGMRVLVTTAILLAGTASVSAEGDAARGQAAFRVCAACHSLEPDKNMTGPSLSGLWERQAGGLKSFSRYSDAMKSSGIIWNEHSLDPWLKNPHEFIPENEMTFRGISDEKARSDLIAFLKEATKPGHATMAQSGGMSGGMMGGGKAPNLKKLEPEDQVRKVTYCGDTYVVTTGDGKAHKFWERNLRFKTDSSTDGPEKGAPAIAGAGMMGDRASVIFSAPEEWTQFVKRECEEKK